MPVQPSWFVMYTPGLEFLMGKLNKNGPYFTIPFFIPLSANSLRGALCFCSALLL